MAAARASRTRQAQRDARRPSGRETYVYGNTVRKLTPAEEPEERTSRARGYAGSAAPAEEPERRTPRQAGPAKKEAPVREPRRQERPRTNYTVRRNQEKALQMDLPYLLLLVIASCCTLYICVTYLHLQSEMSARIDHIKVLEQDIETMKSENDALETRINTSVDLDYVYRVATEELGMVYAGRDQVLLYNKTESEYVRQNEDIPQY